MPAAGSQPDMITSPFPATRLVYLTWNKIDLLLMQQITLTRMIIYSDVVSL